MTISKDEKALARIEGTIKFIESLGDDDRDRYVQNFYILVKEIITEEL